MRAIARLIAEVSALADGFPVIPSSQRRRYRSLTARDSDFNIRIKELAALNAEAVPPAASSEAITEQEAVQACLLETRAAMEVVMGQISGASVTVTSQLLGKVGAAYSALRFHQRQANPALKEQLDRAARRFRRRSDPAPTPGPAPVAGRETPPKPAS